MYLHAQQQLSTTIKYRNLPQVLANGKNLSVPAENLEKMKLKVSTNRKTMKVVTKDRARRRRDNPAKHPIKWIEFQFIENKNARTSV